MKNKINSSAGSLIVMLLFVSLSTHIKAQDLSEQQRLERCQNNKARLKELEKQSDILSAELSKLWTGEETNKAVDDMVYIKKTRMAFIKASKDDEGVVDFYDQKEKEETEIVRVGRKFDFDVYGYLRIKSIGTSSGWISCLEQLESVIAKKIDAAKLTLSRRDDLSQQKTSISKQIATHRTNIIALGCNSMGKAKGEGGSLRLIGPDVVGKSRRESYNAVIYSEYAYTATSVELTTVGDPPDRKVIKWNFDGLPGSLNTDEEYTINITGTLNINAGADLPVPASAGVRFKGVNIVSQQNAYISAKNKVDGKYVFKVPAGAKSVTIEIGADYGGGIFAIYKYEKQ